MQTTGAVYGGCKVPRRPARGFSQHHLQFSAAAAVQLMGTADSSAMHTGAVCPHVRDTLFAAGRDPNNQFVRGRSADAPRRAQWPPQELSDPL